MSLDPKAITNRSFVVSQVGNMRLGGTVINIISPNGQEPIFVVKTSVGTIEVKASDIVEVHSSESLK